MSTKQDASGSATPARGSALSAESAPTPAVSTNAPRLLREPTITGSDSQSATLAVTPGTWSGTPSTYTYTWQDCNGLTGCVSISPASANGTRYELRASDVGHTVRVKVQAMNSAGRTTVITPTTAVILPLAPINAGILPGISGAAQEGQLLTASTGSWTGSPTAYAYQWERCGSSCSAIPDATSSSYMLQSADVGATIEVSVTAGNSGGYATATSSSTPTVVSLPPVNTVAPAISGTAQEGQTLTASTGTWSNSPSGYAYQWQDCISAGAGCSDITGATSPTYTIQPPDVGYAIIVIVTAQNAQGGSSAMSSPTTAVQAATVSSGSCSGSEMCVSLPELSSSFVTGLGTQDAYGFTAQMAQPSGGPSVYSRIQALDPSAWRTFGQDSYNDEYTSQVSPVDYYTTNSGSRMLNAWDFRSLDEQLSEAPASASKEVTQEIPYPLYDCYSGSWTSSGGCTAAGGLVDPTYGAAAAFYADLVRYFRTGVLVSGSGSTTYTSSSLTDSSRTFTSSDNGDCVTATVINGNGFPDWVTGTVSSGSGHTLQLTGNWSTSESYATLSGISIPSATPASGAAYNLASCTAPGDLAGGAGASAANPWPLPPSVGNVQYFEIGNEPDLSNYNLAPASTQAVNIPSAPTLTAVNSANGSLSAGSTYTYSLESDGIQAGGVYCASTSNHLCQGWSTPGSTASVTLPTGSTACGGSTCNAVQISWSEPAAVNDTTPYGYEIFGRTSGTQLGVADVGRDASGCPSACSWTDTGSVTPSGAVNSVNDALGGGNVITPGVYVQEWNVIAPAMRAIDPSIGLNGPTEANTSGYGSPSVDVNCVTTNGPSSACANGDPGYSISTDYIPTLIKYANPQPTVITFHGYGTAVSDTPEANNFTSITSYEIANYDSTDKAAIDAANIPVWIDENNYNASSAAPNSYRSETQLGAAWLTDNMIQWAQADPGEIQNMLQWAANSANPSYQLFSTSTLAGNTSCIPQPTCQNLTASEPNLEYWAITKINNLLAGGGKLVTITNVPTGFKALAVQTTPTKLVVLLVNIQQGSDNGNGAPGNLDIQIAGAGITNTQQTTINANTSMTNGPTTTNLGAQSNTNITSTGYEIDLLTYTLQ
jgi:hypothetical protein